METLKSRSITINLLTLVMIVVSILIIGGLGLTIYTNKVNSLNEKIDSGNKLKNALVDSVAYYNNSFNEAVAEKLTLQASMKVLKNENNNLNGNQKELIKRIDIIEKNGAIIAAALVRTNVKIDSLSSSKAVIDTTNNSIGFQDSTKYVKFDIDVLNITPIKNLKPTININSFELKNKQFVEFHWKDDKKQGHPVTFSVSNDNPYFKSVNIESYIIPEVNKQEIKPNFFGRLGKFVKLNKTFVFVPAAIAGGFLLYPLIK